MSSGEGDDYGLRKEWRRPENPPRAGTGELLQSGGRGKVWLAGNTEGCEDHWGQE